MLAQPIELTRHPTYFQKKIGTPSQKTHLANNFALKTRAISIAPTEVFKGTEASPHDSGIRGSHCPQLRIRSSHNVEPPGCDTARDLSKKRDRGPLGFLPRRRKSDCRAVVKLNMDGRAGLTRSCIAARAEDYPITAGGRHRNFVDIQRLFPALDAELLSGIDNPPNTPRALDLQDGALSKDDAMLRKLRTPISPQRTRGQVIAKAE